VTEPPRYPRIPHLVAGRASGGDHTLGADERHAMLSKPVVIEEKLDGANVMLWLQDGYVQCATRGGADALDRAGQRGLLRAWTSRRAGDVRRLLRLSDVVYAEWLYVVHTIRYDQLPSYLIVLDLHPREYGFVTVDERNDQCAAVNLATPPELFRGSVDGIDDVERLLRPSEYGAALAEGVVVRTLDGAEPRVAKLVRADFTQTTDDAWRTGRSRNQLQAGVWA
jgi:hypothetical protein